ncbi:MAG: hypothetical protein WC975_14230 [Phycisphaerae bacterium]
MASKKIVGLGGGSLYFPRAIPDLLLNTDLSGSEIVLYDLDGEKVEKMAAMGQRLADAAGTGFKIRATTNLADAVDGADFAVSSIGGSGSEITANVYDSYYHSCDMYIPAKYGIHQVVGDTCGPAGMMMALRSIPAYLEICREMEKRCPRAILLNHSNPMAVLCRAMRKYTAINVIGICHGVQHGIRVAAEVLDVSPLELECTWIGTNHYYWFTRIIYHGQDMYPELMSRMARRPEREGRIFSTRLSQAYGFQIVYPEDDHIYEFYSLATQVKDPFSLPYNMERSAVKLGYDARKPMPKFSSPSAEIRKEFFKTYQAILDKVVLPSQPDNSLTGEGLGSLIGAMATGRRQLAIVNVPNQGAISNLPHTALVEIEAVTDSQGVRGIYTGESPLALKGILEKRFVWQELVADAGVKGDYRLALQALLVDEMAIPPEQARAMLDELLAASRNLLPQFKF